MTGISERDWPALRPPADFVERTVSGMLMPVRLAPVSVHRRPRQLFYWFLAALFVSGPALGFAWSRYHQPRSAARIGTVQPLPIPRSMSRPLPSLTNMKAPAVVKRVQKTKPNAERPATPPQKTATPSPQPRTPACQCERGFADFICDCY